MENRRNYAYWGIKKMKFLLVMRLMAFFLLTFSFGVSANTYSQKQQVTLNLERCNVSKLFKEIRKQTGLRFIYNDAYVTQLPEFDVKVEKKNVVDVLEDIFKETAYYCQFEDEVIMVAPRPLMSAKGLPVEQVKTLSVKGRVTDNKGEGLPGVSVLVEGTTTGVSTDVNGNYELKLPQKSNIALVYSFIGMRSQRVAYKGQPAINVVLEDDNVKLDDVVVIGYGTRKKGTITGSVSTIDAGKLESLPVPSLDQALQGQTAGVQVLSESGAPGSSSSVNIRGINSISAGTAPLYVMDGVVVAAGDFAALNNSDIESLVILKDASSTSIYGARAANGVILITTKKGKFGDKAKVNFRGQWGWSAIAYGERDVMNTKERLDYEEMIGLHKDDPSWDRSKYEGIDINWMDVVYNDNAPTSSYDLSVNGGGENLSYYLSAGYFTQEGIAPQSAFDRYSFRLNLEGRAKPWLKVGGSFALGYEVNSYAYTSANSTANPANAAIFMLPYWNPYNPDGSIASAYDGSFLGTQNPLEQYAKAADSRSNKVKGVGSMFLELNPLEGLYIKSMLGMDAYDYRETVRNFPFEGNNSYGDQGELFRRNYSFTLTNTLNYSFSIKDNHRFNILLGQEAIKAENEGFQARGAGMFSTRLMALDLTLTPLQPAGGKSNYAYLSWFGRVSYDLKQKYYVDFSARADGSSRFGADNRWASFWSLGLMWNIKGEDFLANSEAVTNAQVSTSIGTSGNSSIGNYDHLAMVYGGPRYMGMAGWVPNNLGNEQLTWEKLRDFNVGIKLGLWNRVSLDIQYYNKLTKDMLMAVPIPQTVGFSVRADNVGKMTNKGVDMQVDVTLMQVKDFNWSVSANAGYNKNEIKALYNGVDSYVIANTGMILKVGESLGATTAVRYAGVNPANGDAMWYTKDNKLTNKFSSSDEVILPGKNKNAPWSGGFSTNLSYKGLSLSVFFTWVKGRYMLNNTRYMSESNGAFVSFNQSKKMLNTWKQPGDITEIPRYGVLSELDSRYVEDASFLRLKNVALAYNIPSSWLRKTKVIQGLKIFGQAQNLLTFTKYSGFDPESPGNLTLGNYPQTKQFTFGLDLTF